MAVLTDAALFCVGDRQQFLLQRSAFGNVVNNACEKLSGAVV
jgi:hypothetical protein